MSRLLLVEDDEVSALVLATVLTEEQFLVSKASDYAEALHCAAEHPPKLLITDWKLDGVHTGLQIARELQERDPQLKIIFISGLEPADIRSESRDLNVAAVLTKPCDFDEVVAVVRKSLAEN